MCFNPKPAILSSIKKVANKKNQWPNTTIGRQIKFLSEDKVKKYKNDKNFVQIPCGKCLSCKINHANDWATRCVIESKLYKNNSFITLTYNDEQLPKNQSVNVRDLQLFFKRLRKKLRETKIRYFACGEYGSKTLRPHYHIGLYNYKPKDNKIFKFNKRKDIIYTSNEIEKIWGKGFATVGELTLESAAYIARYTQKKIYEKHDEILEKLGRKKEFILTSRKPGIGLHVVTDVEKFEKIKKNFGIFIKQKNKIVLKNIPRIIREKWKEIDALEYYNAAEKNRLKKQKEWQEKMKKISMSEEEYIKMKNEQTLTRIKKLKREGVA